jgi:general stress protein YciG
MPTKQQEATSDRCKAKTKAGGPCAAPAVRGGEFCALHSDPERAAQLGRKGGLRNRHTYERSNEPVAPPESAADVRRMLAETMADVKAGRMDPKVGNTLAYIGTALLRAYEADAPHNADTPAQPYVIYRALSFRDGDRSERSRMLSSCSVEASVACRF